jgi:dual specificity phosphatase 12
MDGDGSVNQLFLAYYPSPALTPRERAMSDPFRSLKMGPTGSPVSLSRRGSTASIGSTSSKMSRKSSSASLRKPSFGMTPVNDESSSSKGRRGRIGSELGMTSISIAPLSSSTNNSPPSPNQPTTPGSANASLRDNIRRMLSQHSEGSKSKTSEEKAAERKAKELESRRTEAQALIEGKKKQLNVGQGRVVVTGRRLRCKMCRWVEVAT